jgi:hypothetical protein
MRTANEREPLKILGNFSPDLAGQSDCEKDHRWAQENSRKILVYFQPRDNCSQNIRTDAWEVSERGAEKKFRQACVSLALRLPA